MQDRKIDSSNLGSLKAFGSHQIMWSHTYKTRHFPYEYTTINIICQWIQVYAHVEGFSQIFLTWVFLILATNGDSEKVPGMLLVGGTLWQLQWWNYLLKSTRGRRAQKLAHIGQEILCFALLPVKHAKQQTQSFKKVVKLICKVKFLLFI